MRGFIGILIVCMLMFSITSVGASLNRSQIHANPAPTGKDDIKIGDIVIDGNRKFVTAKVEGQKLMGGTIGVITKFVSGDFKMHVNYNVNLREDSFWTPPDVGVIGIYRMQGAKNGKNLDMKTFMRDDNGKVEYNVKMSRTFYWDVLAFLGIYGVLENFQINLTTSNLAIAGVVCAKLGHPVPTDIENRLPRYATYIISWGDGSKSIVGPISVSNSMSLPHRYRNSGIYTVRIRVVAKTIGSVEIAHFPVKISKENPSGNANNDKINNNIRDIPKPQSKDKHLTYMRLIKLLGIEKILISPSKLILDSLPHMFHLFS